MPANSGYLCTCAQRVTNLPFQVDAKVEYRFAVEFEIENTRYAPADYKMQIMKKVNEAFLKTP